MDEKTALVTRKTLSVLLFYLLRDPAICTQCYCRQFRTLLSFIKGLSSTWFSSSISTIISVVYVYQDSITDLGCINKSRLKLLCSYVSSNPSGAFVWSHLMLYIEWSWNYRELYLRGFMVSTAFRTYFSLFSNSYFYSMLKITILTHIYTFKYIHMSGIKANKCNFFSKQVSKLF